MAKIIQKNRIVFLVFIFAAFLLFYKITDLSNGFDGDEAAFGYSGYSLLHNLTINQRGLAV